MKNSIFVIKPYRWEGMWGFDDPAVGLVQEPFVGGADTMIDVATAHLPNATQGFLAVFSASYFPDAQIVLERVREEGGGNVYRWAEKGMEPTGRKIGSKLVATLAFSSQFRPNVMAIMKIHNMLVIKVLRHQTSVEVTSSQGVVIRFKS